MKSPTAKSLPVLMYHYVSDYPNTNAVSRAVFDEHCRTLAEHGWKGISLQEAEAFLIHGEPVPEKSVLFTFDDGFLDNYMHAMPILHKYGHQGVMFAVTDRIEEGDTPRASADEVLRGAAPLMPELNAPVQPDHLDYEVRRDTFCNYGEIRAMDASGVMAVASHSKGHLGVFAGPEFTDFVRPGHQRRTFYRTHTPLLWGHPAFKVKPGLTRHAFLPAHELIEAVASTVPQGYDEADAFFKIPGNVELLKSKIDSLGKYIGRFETDAEFTKRLRLEIAGGKAALESVLGHAVSTLCWPWGKFCPEAQQIGRECGFSLFLTTKNGANPPGKPLAVHRFKAKAESGTWLLSRVGVYARPWFGNLYAWMKL